MVTMFALDNQQVRIAQRRRRETVRRFTVAVRRRRVAVERRFGAAARARPVEERERRRRVEPEEAVLAIDDERPRARRAGVLRRL